MTMKVEPDNVRQRNTFIDKETLKREEFKRRRLLRLEQVRQQSKDIASLVRQKVQIERDKQLGLVQERVKAKIQRQQVRRLHALCAEFESTMQNVGKGHAEASNLPNEEMVRTEQAARILDAAQRRGQEALAVLREEESVRRRADEERRTLHQQVRQLENSRSAAVVSLPIPVTTVRPKSPPPKKAICLTAPSMKISKNDKNNLEVKHDVPAWPKKTWPQSILPLGVISTEQQEDSHVSANIRHSPPCANLSCIPSPSVDSLRHNIALGERSSSEDCSKRIQKSNTRLSEPSAHTAEVRMYDYSNLYEKKYCEPHGLAQRIQSASEIDAKQTAEKENADVQSRQLSRLSLAQREQERSQQAIQRLQTHNDYKQLMTSLSVLAKQKATLSSFVCSATNVENMEERRMLTAVEDLLQGGDFEIFNDASLSAPDTPDGTLLVSNLDDTSETTPKLNVGRAGTLIPMSVTSSTPGSPSVTSPPHLNGARHSDSALRSLLQRINHERDLLLCHPQEVPEKFTNVLEINAEHTEQEEVMSLADKVQQQFQQLKQQQSEVQHLDASIKIPECKRGLHGKSFAQPTVQRSPLSHDSIVINSSLNRESVSNVVPLSSQEPSEGSGPLEQTDKRFFSLRQTQGKKEEKSSESRAKEKPTSPMKDNYLYSMDVSMSSVVMDHSTSSTSGSQSVSVRGVQVLVKVCGADEPSSTDSVDVNVDEVVPSAAQKNTSPGNLTSKTAQDFDEQQNSVSHQLQENRLYSNDSKESPPPLSVKSSVKSSTRAAAKSKKIDTKLKGQSMKSKRPSASFSENNNEISSKNKSFSKSQRVRKKKEVKENTFQGGLQRPLEEPTSASTSYFSPPERVLSSLTKDIQTLLAMAQDGTNIEETQRPKKKKKFLQDPVLLKYINRLLTMSRESIEKLHIDCSEVPTPQSDIFVSSGIESASDISVSKETPHRLSPWHYIDEPPTFQVTDSVPVHGTIEDDSIVNFDMRAQDKHQSPAANEEFALSDLTKQCHDKISALTKMLEEVRRQDFVDCLEDHTRFTISPPLDSTTYMSPPPQVLELDNVMLPNQQKTEMFSKDTSDPYTSAVMQLLADVRSEIASQASGSHESHALTTTVQQEDMRRSQELFEMGPPRPRPPVAFWRNLDRCNLKSPTEPHELSTIPELGATLLDSSGSPASDHGSPLSTISPPTDPGTPPDVIAELLQRNILTSPFSWAKKLYKASSEHVKPTVSSDDISSSISPKNSKESKLSSPCSGSGKSDISASKETNTVSLQSQFSSSDSSAEWKTNIILSPVDLCSSTDEVDGDFRRLGIGWVGAMLRKTKEAGALSSTSSSEGTSLRVVGKPPPDDPNEIQDLSDILEDDLGRSGAVAPVIYQGRGHSTPVKHVDASNSPGPSSGKE